MKLTALVLWVTAVVLFFAGLALAVTEHLYLANLCVVGFFVAAPTGLIIYCIGQATELVLNRIDQTAAIGRLRIAEPELSD